eukprot:jgi/Phyca11/100004/e_gw1.4.735.1
MGKRDSSRLDERHKRRRDADKKTKKHKKHKDTERKSHRRHKRSRHSDSDSDSDDAPVPNYTKALKLVRGLLTETPELAGDLLGLLQMLDAGEVAVIGGVENRRIRSKLKELFPLLGLIKLKEPKGAFAKSRKANEAESLMQIFQRMLTGDSENNEIKPKEDAEQAEDKPTDDEDDEVVGPALPGMKGFRLADERVEAEMARKAEQLEKEQWEHARAEEWMTMMPESSMLKDSLGPQNRPPGKPAAFRSKEPAAVDKTWFDSPEERERAKRAKLDMELLGYVREENAPSVSAASNTVSVVAQPLVNESILPNANPEADEEMRKQMEKLRKARGPSLLEQHQRKQAEQAKNGTGSTESAGGWNRDRDLTLRRGMTGDDAERMISAAKQINSKFTAPTISRQFL